MYSLMCILGLFTLLLLDCYVYDCMDGIFYEDGLRLLFCRRTKACL